MIRNKTIANIAAAFAAACGLQSLGGISARAEEIPTPLTCHETARGKASYYGMGFHGRPMANGFLFDKNKISFAHKTLALGTIVRVELVDPDKADDAKTQFVEGEITDRGPFTGNRVLDLSEQAAIMLGAKKKGVVPVKISVCTKHLPDQQPGI